MARASEVTVRITGRSAHIARWQEGADALMAGAGFLCAAEECTGRLNREQGDVSSNSDGWRAERPQCRQRREHPAGAASGWTRMRCSGAQGEIERTGPDGGGQYGVEAEIRFSEGYPPVCNDPELYAASAAALPELCLLEEPLLIAEDFSFYQRCVCRASFSCWVQEPGFHSCRYLRFR